MFENFGLNETTMDALANEFDRRVGFMVETYVDPNPERLTKIMRFVLVTMNCDIKGLGTQRWVPTLQFARLEPTSERIDVELQLTFIYRHGMCLN